MELTPDQVERFVAATESLERAVVGAPKEGNPGLITRVKKLESKMWLVVAVVLTGTGVGNILPLFLK